MKKNIILFSLLTVSVLGFISCETKANAASNNDVDGVEITVADEAAIVNEDEPAIVEASGEVQELTAAQYEKMVSHYKENPRKYIGYHPCIVDFYATWCGPCKRLAPIMEKLAKKYKGRISFYKVDVDQAEKLSAVYGIQSIPTVFFCANGEIRSQVGFIPEEELEEVISELLSAPLK